MTQKKILLVDDQREFLVLAETTLDGDPRYQLLMARDGEEALTIARKEKPDLVFLDVLMPKKDGFAVCSALRQDPATAQTKIIMLTSLDQESDKQKGIEMGADDYFIKPFSPTALLMKIDETLSQNPS